MAIISMLYGAASYVFFLGTFLYAIGFIGNVFVVKSIDSGEPGTVARAVVVNLVLLTVFALQHSIMARRSFKRWWTRFVPAAVERSTYVLAATLALALLLWKWEPIPEPVIWHVTDPLVAQLLWAIFWLGWSVLLVSTFLLNHFELFGLRQVVMRVMGEEAPAAQEFRTPFLYRYVRHPLYLGFILAF
ncbi:MAG TPA: NnrU family protein, partial [Usitatibacter sp.]|nr:NnrU family protein [Usitatibacter sp.]